MTAVYYFFLPIQIMLTCAIPMRHIHMYRRCDITADGVHIATASNDKTLRVWTKAAPTGGERSIGTGTDAATAKRQTVKETTNAVSLDLETPEGAAESISNLVSSNADNGDTGQESTNGANDGNGDGSNSGKCTPAALRRGAKEWQCIQVLHSEAGVLRDCAFSPCGNQLAWASDIDDVSTTFF